MKTSTNNNLGSLSIQTLLLTSKLISIAGLIWGFMYCALGMYFPAVFPFSYTIIMTIVILLFHKGIYNEKQLVSIELFLILLLPALLQWSIGSFISSGAVVLWSLLAPTGSLLFQNFKKSVQWFGAFIVVISILIIYEFFYYQDSTANSNQIMLFSAMNITAISGILFYSLSYFVNQYGTKQKAVDKLLEIESQGRKELVSKTQHLELVLEEKEILLKEIHHRVKNNMQVITSLISLQLKNVEDTVTEYEFQQINNRIKSMAMVHEMLYQSTDFACIDYGAYIENLASGLLESMKGDKHNITFQIDVQEVELNMDTAIPLGLLINELFTNAIKYAFPNTDEGIISVVINSDSQHYTMRVSDNGIGFPADYDFENTSSLGLSLVQKLVTQLEGTLVRSNTKGTQYDITLKKIDSNL